jgi:hypothetical protein
MFLENADVRKLFDYYRDALEQIFSFYATSDKRTSAAMALPSYGAGGGTALGLSGRSPARGGGGGGGPKGANSMKAALGYQEFLKLASGFDLSNTVILSTIELGGECRVGAAQRTGNCWLPWTFATLAGGVDCCRSPRRADADTNAQNHLGTTDTRRIKFPPWNIQST